jgi:uncharacterized protein YqeY
MNQLPFKPVFATVCVSLRAKRSAALLRSQFTEALTAAMKAKDVRSTGTLRLILAALKDRDIAARTKGGNGEIDETAILGMMQSMIKQRRESISLYEQGGRLELAQQEGEEIEVIERFLPAQMDEDAIAEAVTTVIGELGAASLKDMGRTIGALKERYSGEMDFSKASALVKERLG